MRRKAEFTEHPVEFAILGLLYESPRYGYELYRSLRVKSGLGLIWTVKQAQLYSILAKFESKGLLSAKIDDSGRINRKMYALSAEGGTMFMDWVASPSLRKDFYLEFLAKLYFVRLYFPQSAARLVDEQIALCEGWLSDMKARLAASHSGDTDGLVFRYRVGQLESMLRWLRECREAVSRDASGPQAEGH